MDDQTGSREIPQFNLDTNYLEETAEASAKFVLSTVPKTTLNKRKSDASKFTRFLDGKSIAVEDVGKMEGRLLNALLMEFVMCLKPTNGADHYEPGTIQGILYSLEHFLKESGQADWRIRDSTTYAGLREVCKSKKTMSKNAGKGNRPNRAKSMSVEEEKKMWETGALGTENPDALLRTLWWGFTTGFGLRGRDEHRNLLWKDVELKEDNKEEFLEFTERATKTRKGNGLGREICPKIFCTCKEDPKTCVIEACKIYAEHRPEGQEEFYLAAKTGVSKVEPVWFKKSPVGQNKLGNMMRSGAEVAGLAGKMTNHSGRRTTVKRLLDGGCPETYAKQYTGHKSTAGLASYADADDSTHRKMAKIVTSNSSFTAPTTANLAAKQEVDATSLGHALMQGAFSGCTINTVQINVQMK